MGATGMVDRIATGAGATLKREQLTLQTVVIEQHHDAPGTRTARERGDGSRFES
jgi:hypothetical protein